MTINANTSLEQTLFATLSTKTKEISSISEFETELQRQLIENLQSQKKVEDIQSDVGLEEFKRKLSSMGAVGFLQAFNLDKIETLIEKKKDELIHELGLSENTVPPLSQNESKEALKTLEALLDNYKKELLEKMKAEEKLEKNNQILTSVLQQF